MGGTSSWALTRPNRGKNHHSAATAASATQDSSTLRLSRTWPRAPRRPARIAALKPIPAPMSTSTLPRLETFPTETKPSTDSLHRRLILYAGGPTDAARGAPQGWALWDVPVSALATHHRGWETQPVREPCGESRSIMIESLTSFWCRAARGLASRIDSGVTRIASSEARDNCARTSPMGNDHQ